MPKFYYTAKDQTGALSQGELELSERKDVAEFLRKRNKWAIKIEEVKKTTEAKVYSDVFLNHVSLKSKMIFSRHLGVMVASSLSLSRALSVLATQEKNSFFKGVIENLSEDVKKGISLTETVSKYPRIFNKVFVAMINVGELGGTLENILKLLAEQMEKDYKLISKVKSALIYPAIIVFVMLVIGVLMMIFVIPKITFVFKEFDVDLPFLTRAVIVISDFMSQHILLTLSSLMAVVTATQLFSETTMGIKFFHKFFIKLPIFGPVICKINSARFARILSSLLKSGVSLVEALNITADTLGNYYFKKIVAEAASDVQKGVPLSRSLKQAENFFPYLVIQMVEVGEETGKTPQVLEKLAIFYEEEVDQITKNLSSIIEPLLIVIIGLAVGLFALSIIQPIYSIMDNI